MNIQKMKIGTAVLFTTLCMSMPTEVSAQSFLDKLKSVATDASKQSNNSGLSALVQGVLGTSKVSEADLKGTWNYAGADCAFSSENLLAKAGGEVAAEKIEAKLNEVYFKLKITSANTSYTFNEDKSCVVKIAGRSIRGTYTFDAEKGTVTIQSTLLKTTAYVAKSGSNLCILHDASKLLTLLRTVAKISGNSSLNTISTLSENYNGVKLGFELSK